MYVFCSNVVHCRSSYRARALSLQFQFSFPIPKPHLQCCTYYCVCSMPPTLQKSKADSWYIYSFKLLQYSDTRWIICVICGLWSSKFYVLISSCVHQKNSIQFSYSFYHVACRDEVAKFRGNLRVTLGMAVGIPYVTLSHTPYHIIYTILKSRFLHSASWCLILSPSPHSRFVRFCMSKSLST